MRFALVALLALLSLAAQETARFTNPLLPAGADPWVISRNGVYYYMQTTGNNLTIWKTADITDLAHAQKRVVWTPPASGPYSRDIWAPELHYLRGKWYLYFAADAGRNESHRMYVLENSSEDPLSGAWTLRGKVADSSDKWAIDGTVFENGGQLYMAWSGWPGDQDGEQDIYMARLSNPWTISGSRVLVSAPAYDWEKHGDLPGPRHVNVNEGPEFLVHGSSVFLIYAASGCWTDDYQLGMLRAAADAELLNPSSWKKSPNPVFQPSPQAHAYGAGHPAFFKSPDGKEDWIGYHANPEAHQGCGAQRSPRVQPFKWKADGTPDFGTPAPADQPIPKPSGTP